MRFSAISAACWRVAFAEAGKHGGILAYFQTTVKGKGEKSGIWKRAGEKYHGEFADLDFGEYI